MLTKLIKLVLLSMFAMLTVHSDVHAADATEYERKRLQDEYLQTVHNQAEVLTKTLIDLQIVSGLDEEKNTRIREWAAYAAYLVAEISVISEQVWTGSEVELERRLKAYRSRGLYAERK